MILMHIRQFFCLRKQIFRNYGEMSKLRKTLVIFQVQQKFRIVETDKVVWRFKTFRTFEFTGFQETWTGIWVTSVT